MLIAVGVDGSPAGAPVPRRRRARRLHRLVTYAVDCNSPSPSDALRTGVLCLAAPWPALLAVYAGSICARLVTGL
ncbi:hypothetical protein ACIA7R_27710 [Micromonospora chalcea]